MIPGFRCGRNLLRCSGRPAAKFAQCRVAVVMGVSHEYREERRGKATEINLHGLTGPPKKHLLKERLILPKNPIIEQEDRPT
jgi:hypothetical protein